MRKLRAQLQRANILAPKPHVALHYSHSFARSELAKVFFVYGGVFDGWQSAFLFTPPAKLAAGGSQPPRSPSTLLFSE